jgi:hypothetical protein
MGMTATLRANQPRTDNKPGSAFMVALGVGVQVENERRYWFFCATAKPIVAG